MKNKDDFVYVIFLITSKFSHYHKGAIHSKSNHFNSRLSPLQQCLEACPEVLTGQYPMPAFHPMVIVMQLRQFYRQDTTQILTRFSKQAIQKHPVYYKFSLNFNVYYYTLKEHIVILCGVLYAKMSIFMMKYKFANSVGYMCRHMLHNYK